jgi:Mor family transcriptional regulator
VGAVKRETRDQKIVRRFHERASPVGLARGYGMTRLEVEEIIRRDLRRVRRWRVKP